MRLDNKILFKLKKHIWIVGVAMGLTASAFYALNAETQEVDSPVTQAPENLNISVFMRAKLASSQMVLEGLVRENFELIKEGADRMARMSEAAEWPRAPDKIYDHYSEEFRRQSSKLKRLAENGNLEGASFTHMQMTATCISCHDYVRKSLRIAKDPTGRPGAVRLIPSEWDE